MLILCFAVSMVSNNSFHELMLPSFQMNPFRGLKSVYKCLYSQGFIRPRPSPSWRPSTRYNGVSDPPRGGGGFDCRISARGGDSIAGFPYFRARSARKGVEGAVLENFEDF